MAIFSRSTLNKSSLKMLPSSSMAEDESWTSADLSDQCKCKCRPENRIA